MGCMGCKGSRTIAGEMKELQRVNWDGLSCEAEDEDGLEVGGVPLREFLTYFTDLNDELREQVFERIIKEPCRFKAGSGDWLKRRRPVKAAVFSWNVGGISDFRKDTSANLWSGLVMQDDHVASVDATAIDDIKMVLSNAVQGMAEEEGSPDVIVVGLQEMISLTAGNAWRNMSKGWQVPFQGKNTTPWLPEIVNEWSFILSEGLKKVKFRSKEDCTRLERVSYVAYGTPVWLFGMLLCVFCRTECLRHIRDFDTKEVPMDNVKTGSKGAIACRFTLFDRSFCFVNCHLAANTGVSEDNSQKQLKTRLKQLERCWLDMQFRSTDNRIYPAQSHRAFFLFGDTNMRLSRPKHITNQREWHNFVTEQIKQEAYSKLWENDQLLNRTPEAKRKLKHGIKNFQVERTNGVLTPTLSNAVRRCMESWEEPFRDSLGPQFPPTYRKEIEDDESDYSKKRVPAWTDRVMYRSMHTRPVAYNSVKQSKVVGKNLSDHDPVYAMCIVECTTLSLTKLSSMVRDAQLETTNQRSNDPNMSSSAADQVARRQYEARQARALHLRLQEIAQPAIDQMCQRLFRRLLETTDSDFDLMRAQEHMELFHEECWPLVCLKIEQEVTESIRDSRPRDPFMKIETGGQPPLNCEMLSANLKEVLDKIRGEVRSQLLVHPTASTSSISTKLVQASDLLHSLEGLSQQRLSSGSSSNFPSEREAEFISTPEFTSV
mmetsp:Transcript_15293/g.27942  ORF Transcript_15293/g.27942 Transcript_15293/m.27942 type:complete len:715 (-) Transcript_15293:31-2175(-)